MRIEALIAATPLDPLPQDDPREPVRVLIASLAPGGAERIVLEWLGAEAATGRACELAVLHARRIALAVPAGVTMLARGNDSPAGFMARLAQRWSAARAPVSTHLVGDDLLALLWQGGVRTVPVVHNALPGWRNEPRNWRPADVPRVVACAQAVEAELQAHGCRPPLLAVRHRPAVAPAATDAAERLRMRSEAGIGPDCFVMLAVGAIKAQKDYPRAVEVLARLAAQRDAVLVIAGGVLDAQGLGLLDGVLGRAIELGVADRLRLPGFVDPIAPWFAAADVLVNVSRYEGLSMAVREALAAGLPVLATDVGGQRESDAPHLTLVAPDTPAARIAAHLGMLPVRDRLSARPVARLPRQWSMTLVDHRCDEPDTDTLLITANLNAGGAQRSLVNLAVPLARRHRLAVGVCGPGTHTHFADRLLEAGVRVFRAAPAPEPLALAEALLAWAARHGVRNLCFWNVDARVKLLVARFAPPRLRLIDVSPGHYAFEELEAASRWAAAFDSGAAAYHARLDELVLKYRVGAVPEGPRCRVIPNGVAVRPARDAPPEVPRFLVSGRIAPSKRLEVVLEAFRSLRAALPLAQLHVVGSAEPRHAAYAAQVLRDADAGGIAFHGPLPDLAHLADPYTAAIVLGTHQGSPNAVLEAMSAGIPVIANASGGTGEIVIEGETGWLLPEACDAAQLAQAMRQAAEDRAGNRQRGDAARAFVQRHHGIDDMVLRYAELFAGEVRSAGADRLAA